VQDSDMAGELVERAERMAVLGIPKESILIDLTHDFDKNTWPGFKLGTRPPSGCVRGLA
jgi:dihydropteroate synthase